MKDLLSEYVPRLYRFALRLTGDRHAAEEITQEAFLRGWRHRTRLQSPDAACLWLFRIAVNVWRDLARRRKHPAESATPLAEEDLHCGPTPDQVVADREEVRLVIQSMDSLPPRQRQVLYLTAIEGLKHAEIAEVLGTSVEAVKANLSLARKSMRQRLGDLDPKRGEVS